VVLDAKALESPRPETVKPPVATPPAPTGVDHQAVRRRRWTAIQEAFPGESKAALATEVKSACVTIRISSDASDWSDGDVAGIVGHVRERRAQIAQMDPEPEAPRMREPGEE